MILSALLLGTIDVPEITVRTDHPVYWSADRWAVYPFKDEGTCDLGYREVNDEYLTIAYDAKEKFIRLLITNKNASSLQDNQNVKLTLIFRKNGKIIEEWNQINFTARRLSDQPPALASDIIISKALNDFEKYDDFAIFTETDKIVSLYNLNGSAEAIQQLRDCAIEVAEINPNDPFMKE